MDLVGKDANAAASFSMPDVSVSTMVVFLVYFLLGFFL